MLLKKTIMRITRYFLLLVFAIVISCKSSDVGPKNYFSVDAVNYPVELSAFDDYGILNGEYNIEFYLYGSSLEDIAVCVNDEENCNLTALFFDLYNDKSILQNGTFEFDESYEGSNHAYAEFATIVNGRETYFAIESGTLEVTGVDTEKLLLKFEGVGEAGQVVKADFEGKFENIEDVEDLLDDLVGVKPVSKNPNSFSLKNTKVQGSRNRTEQLRK